MVRGSTKPNGRAHLDVIDCVAFDDPDRSDYLTIVNVTSDSVPAQWRALVVNMEEKSERFDRRQLEVFAVLELADAIKAGEMYVTGSLSHDHFWDRLPAEASEPTAMAAYFTERGWTGGAEGFTTELRDALEKQASELDECVHRYGIVEVGKDGRPIVSSLERIQPPPSAIDLERAILDRVPERPILSALSNTQQWTGWDRHFRLPSRLGPQIKDATQRYVLTAFTYGCGLGPSQAARHLEGDVSADQLRFVDRRHIDIEDLRSASADLTNLYAQFELPRLWGTGDSAVADGTHFQTFEDNLLAEQHIRYGKTGGIAHRHIADNYIALFSSFIACGHYEAIYILDALQKNTSDIRPRRVHADTHGQSATVFGLAYLLGIELMPRIRYWKKLRFYRPNSQTQYRTIDALFSGTVN